MPTKISSTSLKALIAQSGKRQAEIAEKAKIDPRHLTRLLKDDRTVRDTTVVRLAKALEVESGVLTGVLPLPDGLGDGPTVQPRVEHRQRISRASRNAYELISLRYGIEVRALTELAPLCFAVIAEMSLADRRARLAELRAAYDARASMRGDLGYLPYRATHDPVAEGIMRTEEGSVSSRDVFGWDYHDALADDDQGVAEWWECLEVTPLEVWLRDKAAALKLDCAVHGVTYNDSTFSLEHDLALQIAEGDEALRDTILKGSVLLNGMPGLKRDFFWTMLTLPPAEARLAWLRQQIDAQPTAHDQRPPPTDESDTPHIPFGNEEPGR